MTILPEVSHHRISDSLSWVKDSFGMKFVVVGLLQRNIRFTLMFDHLHLIQQTKFLNLKWSFKLVKSDFCSTEFFPLTVLSLIGISLISFGNNLTRIFCITFGLNFVDTGAKLNF